MTALVLAAPLAGWATRLDEVPDPAFAQGLVGDGVAIDPTSSELCAPCDGVVASVHRARHACTVRTDGGAEILLHIGVDTVELRGEGFEVLVAEGQRVWTRDPLIRFDLDRVSRRARSLHTPVLLVGGDGLAVVERTLDREVAVGDPLLAIARLDARSTTAVASAGAARPGAGSTGAGVATLAERRVRLALPHGLHARPAAVLARRARPYAGDVTVACGRRSANGKSAAGLMTLDARLGDELAISVVGPHADALADELAALVAAGLPIAGGATIASDPRANGASIGSGSSGAGSSSMFAGDAEIVLEGIAAAGGLASGRAVRMVESNVRQELPRDGADAAVELARLAAAIGEVRREIAATVEAARARGDTAAAEIFGAHLELIDDPEITAEAEREISAGRSAEWAWQVALQQLSKVLRGLGNPLLAERTADLGDLERRTLARLSGAAAGSRVPAEIPEGAVIIADELMPSELAALPVERVAGICTARGGATSHVAILAAGMAVPAVVALGDDALRVPDGAPLIVDGDRGQLRAFPAIATRGAADRAIARRASRRRDELARAHEPAHTTDGVAISMLANLGAPGDAAAALASGAEGCGLVRTEFLFLDRRTPPSEDEQAARYQALADALPGRALVFRTLDAGGDKPLAYLPHGREDNPALGVRGVRLALRHPDLLRAQLRAILRVTPAGARRIMVPMIASLAELRAVRAMLDVERRALGAPPVELGAMIEVPAAALAAGALAREAEFLSIGSNDLAQYALAMDRGNRDVASGLDSLHPGVLRLIASAAAAATARGRPASVCGGAAADPIAVPLLLGLGVRTLSVAPLHIPTIKAVIRTLSLARCVELAAAALDADSGDAVRALVVARCPALAPDHWPEARTEPTPDLQPDLQPALQIDREARRGASR